MIEYKGKLFDVDTEEEAEKLLNFSVDPDIDAKAVEEAKATDAIQDALAYLSDTDWYYARKMETGEDVPTEVSTKRTEAREFLRSKGY